MLVRRTMRPWSVSSGSMIGALMLVCAAPAVAEDATKATLQTRYDALKAAIAAHDGSALGALLAPDFTSVDISGKSETAPQMIAELSGLKTDPNKVSATTLESVAVVEGTATVEQQYNMQTSRAGSDGVAHQIKLSTLSTDTWVKSGDAWLLQRTVTDETSLFRDGNLVTHKTKP